MSSDLPCGLRTAYLKRPVLRVTVIKKYLEPCREKTSFVTNSTWKKIHIPCFSFSSERTLCCLLGYFPLHQPGWCHQPYQLESQEIHTDSTSSSSPPALLNLSRFVSLSTEEATWQHLLDFFGVYGQHQVGPRGGTRGRVCSYGVQGTAARSWPLTRGPEGIAVNTNSDSLLPTDALPAGFPLRSHAVPGQQEPDRHPGP